MLTELQRVEKLKEKFLSPEELQGLLKASEVSIRDHAILLISYQYGLRISEVSILQLEDYQPDKNRVFIKRIKEGIGNFFLVNEDLKRAMRKWLILRGDKPGPLFPSRKSRLINGTKGIGKRQLDKLFKVYAEKGGVERQHWNFHTLRHTCAVNMVDDDIPMKMIQDHLGHKSIQSTMIYAQVSSAKRNEATTKFLKIGKEKEIRGTGINWGKVNKDKKTKEIKNLEKVRETT